MFLDQYFLLHYDKDAKNYQRSRIRFSQYT